MSAQRKSIAEHKITEPINLGDLRWLVAQCEGLPDDSDVTVKEHRDLGPMDRDLASIKVRGQMVQ